MIIGILGGNGLLGSVVATYFKERGHEVFPIGKEAYEANKGRHFDVFVNANGNSRRFWANQNPEADYEASVVSVKRSISDFSYNLYVYISSSDVYPDHDDPKKAVETEDIDTARLSVYGLHKFQAETLVQALPRFVILRVSAMLGPNLKKGVVYDLEKGNPLFVTNETALQFVTTREVARVIECFLKTEAGLNAIYNCGGVGTVALPTIAEVLGVKPVIRDDAHLERYEMDVKKLSQIVPLKASLEYLTDFIHNKDMVV